MKVMSASILPSPWGRLMARGIARNGISFFRRMIYAAASVEMFTTYHRVLNVTGMMSLRVFQGGSSNVSTHRSLQENEASQGVHILPRVDTGRSADCDRK